MERISAQGGCLCGNIRYQIDAQPIDAGFCHCRLCQRATGAPVVAWVTLPLEGFRYLQGSPAVFQSSSHSQREHCAACGTALVFRKSVAPVTLDVTLCSLDEPSLIKPQYHIWLESRVDWLHISDDLPQHAGAGPDQH